MLKVRIDLNKSPSTSTLNCPFCNSVKLLTIAKPNPEPLVFLDFNHLEQIFQQFHFH